MLEKKFDLAKCLRDVALVKKHAEIILEIKEGQVTVSHNSDPYIRSLVVLGPYCDEEVCLQEAVLLEVGLRRGKPYRKGESPRHSWVNGRPINLPERRDDFKLTQEQYLMIVPTLFRVLSDYATERILAQDHGWYDPRWVKVEVSPRRNPFTGKTESVKWVQIRPSIRFSISKKDTFLASDVFWIELFGRENRTDDLKETTRYLGDCFGRYALPGRKNWPRDWMSKPYFATAINILREYPWYIQVFLWKTNYGPSHYFHYEIMEKIRYEGFDPWEEVLRNRVLPDPKERVGQYSIRVVRTTDRYVTFDLYPVPPAWIEPREREYREELPSGPRTETEYDDEIPF